MIVLSVGMPRAGSAWHYSIIHDLLAATGSVEVRDIRVRYRLQNVLTDAYCNIGVLSVGRLGKVMIPALMGKTFAIKAHAGPTRASRLFQRLGLLRITYMYRDPRDALLSAFEAGQDALRNGRINAFSHLTDFNKSLDFMMDYVEIWEEWSKEKDVLLCRYEDLLTKYDDEMQRLVRFLPLDGSSPEARAERSRSVQKVIERYRPGAEAVREQVHFHVGKVGRFRESFTAQQQSILWDRFAAYLPRMGYDK